MPNLSKETKRFISQIFMPGMMFLSVWVISWLHQYTVRAMSPEELAKMITVAEVEQSMDAVAQMYVLVIGTLLLLSIWAAFSNWLDSRTRKTEEARVGGIHVVEPD